MPEEAPHKKLPRLGVLVGALLILISVLHMGGALLGKALIRPSHLGVALNYARDGIDLLRPMMPGFNVNGVPTAQEFPLWQAAAGLAFRLTNSQWYGWANLVSLLLFASALWPFLQLARHYVGERAAWWSLAFLLAQPLIVVMAGEAATDGFSLAATLWFLFFADRMIRSGNMWYWLPTALFAIISALSKLPFFMAVGLCALAILLMHDPRVVKSWLLLASAGGVAGVALMIWTHYTNGLAAQAEYPYYDLRLSDNPDLQQWFFGDMRTRLRPNLWAKGGWRFLHATLGVLPLVALPLLAFLRRGGLLGKWWLAATGVVTLVFTPVVLNHWHYFLMCCPAVALLCGITLARWEPFWAEQMPRAWLRLLLAFVVLTSATIDGLVTMKISLDYDSFPRRISALLRDRTSPEDKLLIYGEPGWGGEMLFRSGRAGLSVYSLETPESGSRSVGLRDLLTRPEHLERLKELGFTKLVLLSESPVRFAVQAANPGAQRTRILYPETIAPAVDAWPDVFRSEDILIKSIP